MNSADEFLKQKHVFQLGVLPTETPHPLTEQLSEWAQHDLERALRVLREIDLAALALVQASRVELDPLFTAVSETLNSGGRVFLVGCGATGRLSLSLEYLWRTRYPGSEQVISFMAGGDAALVHALEKFEDFPAYGARALNELGFGPNDLLLGPTEGGETPFVIGAVEEAARISRREPFLLFCNPRDVLIAQVERSRRVLTNPRVRTVCLPTGPMALTGSTRMQASTVLQLAIGLALEFGADTEAAFATLAEWIEFVHTVPSAALKGFTEAEADTYARGDHTVYAVEEMAITAFTDTTERAPTFNLAPFDNPLALTERHSLTYITIPSAPDGATAWRTLLAHEPRPLEWPEIHPRATRAYLTNFDFGARAVAFRRGLRPERELYPFTIASSARDLRLSFRGETLTLPRFGRAPLFDHLLLKMLLNAHSTLLMGRLDRFEGNLMTWVYPSNGKLIDRAARYTQILLARRGVTQFTYDDIVRAQFTAFADLSPSESVVHKTMALLMRAPNARTPRPEFRERR